MKSISLEEIERWSEVEASFLPESAKQSAVRSEAPKTPSLQQPSLKSHSEEEGASESPSLQESNSASPCPAVQKVSASEETESSSQMQMPGVKTETPAAADSAPSATSEASVTQAEKDSPAEGPASSAEAGEDEDEEGKYHALFMAELKAATAKEAAAKEASAKAAKDKLQQREKAESEAEEEEPLYSDHDDDDERPSAEDAAGDPTKAKEGAGEEDQAKEQLANLSYFDLVKVRLCSLRKPLLLPPLSARARGSWVYVQRVGLKKELPIVNHALCKFPPIKKNLYVQVKTDCLSVGQKLEPVAVPGADMQCSSARDSLFAGEGAHRPQRSRSRVFSQNERKYQSQSGKSATRERKVSRTLCVRRKRRVTRCVSAGARQTVPSTDFDFLPVRPARQDSQSPSQPRSIDRKLHVFCLPFKIYE